MIALIALALATPPADAPRQLHFTAPDAQALRVRLPADAVGVDPRDLLTTLYVQDEAGNEIPYTIAQSGENSPAETQALLFTPVATATWTLSLADRPLNRLRLDFSRWEDGPVAVSVGGGPPSLLFQYTQSSPPMERRELPVVGRGPFTIQARGVGIPQLIEAVGISEPPENVPDAWTTLTAPVGVLTEDGTVRYALDLGGPRHVTGLRFDVGDELFDRNVRIGVPTESRVPMLDQSGQITRVKMAGTAIDRTLIDGIDLRTDSLIVDVTTDVGRALDVRGIDVRSTGAELILKDVKAGAYTVFVGGLPHGSSSDLGGARVELMRTAAALDASTTPVEPNPAWIPRATVEQTDGVGAPINLARWRFGRPIDAPPGWARIPIDRTVLAHARPDLADLRVIDAEGNQVPMLVYALGGEEPWTTPPFERTEKGSRSEIRVELGEDDAPVASVRLKTGRDLFAREVTILRDRGTITEPLRRVRWQGTEQGHELAIAVDAVLGRTLLIQIENGDNPPLPVEAIEVTSPRWEARAKIPGPGARLVYGSPRDTFPTYDLALLRDDVQRMPVAVATLGPEAALGGVKASVVDKAVVAAAIAVLALGLLGLVIRVLRGATNPETASTPPAAGG